MGLSETPGDVGVDVFLIPWDDSFGPVCLEAAEGSSLSSYSSLSPQSVPSYEYGLASTQRFVFVRLTFLLKEMGWPVMGTGERGLAALPGDLDQKASATSCDGRRQGRTYSP